MADKDDELTVQALFARAAAMERSSLRGRTKLFVWMLDRASAFAVSRSGPVRTSWDALAAAATAAGLMTRDGRPITGETMRNTWWQVRRFLRDRDDTAVIIQPLKINAHRGTKRGRRRPAASVEAAQAPQVEPEPSAERTAPAVVRDPPWLKR